MLDRRVVDEAWRICAEENAKWPPEDHCLLPLIPTEGPCYTCLERALFRVYPDKEH